MVDINLSLFQRHIEAFKNLIATSGETSIDFQTFQEKVTKDRSIFLMLDQNWDDKISEDDKYCFRI